MKIYSKKFKYYKEENSLNIFIRVFKDLYFKISVKLKEYRDIFSIILISKANEFYY